MLSVLLLITLLGEPQTDNSAGADTAAYQNAHSQLEGILDQPLFQRWKLRQQRAHGKARTSTLLQGTRELLGSALRSIGRFLGKLLGGLRFPNFGSAGGLVSSLKLILWCGIAATVLYFLLLIYRLLSAKSGQPHGARVLTQEDVRTALESGDALALDGSQWLAEGQRLANAGEFRPVYRAMYLALLSGLHGAGKIEYRRQRTNWTYVARFRGSDSERSTFAELTSLFDDVWYGLKEAQHANLDMIGAKVSALVGRDINDV